VQLIHRLAQAEQSAAEWAARYSEEAARVDELAEQNVALLDQIANLTSLLTACTGAQPPPTAAASTAAALVVGPPSTAAPSEEAGAAPVLRWSIVRGCSTPHAAYSRTKRHACSSDVSVQRQRAANSKLRTHATALQGTRTALARKAQRRTRRPLLGLRPWICRTTVMPSPRPSISLTRAKRAGRVFCVQACSRRTLARNGGCCKQPVRAPVRDSAGRVVSHVSNPLRCTHYPGATV
jgi:hypothetical protein